MWTVLRRAELHFRRQAPFGPYIVDFVCHGARLIIEVDGGIHDYDDVKLRDAEREAWLRERGYVVIRVTNEEALFDPVGAVERIAAKLGIGAHAAIPFCEGE